MYGGRQVLPGLDSDLTQCVKNQTKNIFLSKNEERKWKNGCRSATENEVKLGTQFNMKEAMVPPLLLW